jgi:4-amino-4-deoxy-L-arabinose transferase-like glycosyltransferase
MRAGPILIRPIARLYDSASTVPPMEVAVRRATGRRASVGERVSGARWIALLSVVGLAGVALRIWIDRSALGIPDSDEGVVGLMTMHLLDGEWTTFFWGQGFGGSQEAILTAPLFALFGPSWLALRVVPIALTGVTALVVWRVGRRTLGEPAATFAGCVMWIWPPFLLQRLTHQYGFYASGVLYCALLLLLALRLGERPTRARAAVFGLALGLALWESAQVLPIAVGVVAWTVWRRPAWLRESWAAALCLLVGFLPSLAWNVGHDWASLHSTIADTTSYAHRLRIFASPLLGMLLGLRTPYTQERLLPALVTFLAYAGLASLFVYGAYRSRRRDASLLYVVAAVFPFVYALAPQTLFSQEPRYLLVLAPVVVLLGAQLATSYLRGLVVVGVALAISAATIARMDTYVRDTPAQPPKAPRSLAPLVATLDRLGVDRVYADFWLSYRLTFETQERIIAAQSKLERVGRVNGDMLAARHPFIRHRAYEREVEAGPHGFVVFRAALEQGADRTPGPEADARAAQLAALVSDLEAAGYRRVDAGPFVVLASPGAD